MRVNHCRDLVDDLERHDEAGELAGGEWVVVACSDTCMVSVRPS